MKHLLFLLLTGFSTCFLWGQITGTINTYTSVNSLDYTNHSVNVNSTAGFVVGDRVLLIQMQGATIDAANNSNFGSVNNLNGAGLLELQRVCDISSDEITFENELVHTYNPLNVSNAGIQLIRVPEYTDVTVGAIGFPAWDGTTGGVVALVASGTVTLANDIDISGMGFRGGAYENQACVFPPASAYFYSQGDASGAKKGEGIASYLTSQEYGRGPLANGGGGGNDHNAGGGGGGNYALGGEGGERHNFTGFFCTGTNEGLGGKALSALGYSALNNRAFMGGGGGAGNGNNNEGESGGPGGGMILIMANAIEGNGFTLRSNGEQPGNAGSDGGGGGGAGGTILLDVSSYGTTPLNLETQGADGGGSSYIASDCMGPGGGGSGGVVWLSTAPSANVTTNVNGGASGITKPTLSCGANTNGGAQPGGNGAVISSPPLAITAGTNSNGNCALPVQLVFFALEQEAGGPVLNWELYSLVEPSFIVVERSLDGVEFSPLAQIGYQAPQQSWQDRQAFPGTAYYRLQVLQEDGGVVFSKVIEYNSVLGQTLQWSLFPNPVSEEGTLNVSLNLPESDEVWFQVHDLSGRVLLSEFRFVERGPQVMALEVAALSSGTYLLSLSHRGRQSHQKWTRL
jgi:hypothetical protein